MISVIKVTGNSLSPLFLSGDYVVINKCRFLIKAYLPGDIIVFNHPDLGLLIKKVLTTNSTQRTYEVGGTHPLSKDSSSLGPISHDNIIGKVVFHIKKPRNSLKS
jgi:signal peptidase I